MKLILKVWGLLSIILMMAACTPEGPQGGGDNDKDEQPAGYQPVKADAYDWDGEKKADISYQLLVYSFADSDGDGTGDFQGIIDKLDYLDSLGVTALWLSPIHPAQSYHGYDVLAYDEINPDYGTMDDFKELVAAAKAKDIKIYIDYVLNHSGSKHPWFLDAASSEDSPYRDWYIFSETPAADIAAGKIDMIARQGEGGYDAGQWFTVSADVEKRLKFVLDWTNAAAPTVTVTETSEEVYPEDTDAHVDGDKYLFCGDPGKAIRFREDGGNKYSLVLDFNSPWGFLVRTHNGDQWENNTKYGAQDANNAIIRMGVPFTLYTSVSSGDVKNVVMPGSTFFHSHFWTDWFADLNYGKAETCETSGAFKKLVEIGHQWVDAGISGMRLDAVKHIYHDENSDENPIFLDKFYKAMDSYYSGDEPFYMIGEVLSGHAQVAPYYAGLPACFEFQFWWDLSSAINEGKGNTLVKKLLSYEQEYASYRADYIKPTKLSNHDEDRAGHTLGESVEKMKLAGAVLLTAAGSPYIYYGEEMGYIGHKGGGDEYVRSPMLWGDSYQADYLYGKKYAGLEEAVGTLAAQAADPNSVFRVYKNFAKARNIHPELAKGKMIPHEVFNENVTTLTSVCAWYMEHEGQRVVVYHNFGGEEVDFLLRETVTGTIAVNGNVLLNVDNSKQPRLKMGAYSSVVFDM